MRCLCAWSRHKPAQPDWCYCHISSSTISQCCRTVNHLQSSFINFWSFWGLCRKKTREEKNIYVIYIPVQIPLRQLSLGAPESGCCLEGLCRLYTSSARVLFYIPALPVCPALTHSPAASQAGWIGPQKPKSYSAFCESKSSKFKTGHRNWSIYENSVTVYEHYWLLDIHIDFGTKHRKLKHSSEIYCAQSILNIKTHPWHHHDTKCRKYQWLYLRRSCACVLPPPVKAGLQ